MIKFDSTKKYVLLFVAAIGISITSVNSEVFAQDPSVAPREFYQLQIFRIPELTNRDSILGFLKDHQLPAINRFGIETVGVFLDTNEVPATNDVFLDTNEVPATNDVFVLIPFQSIEQVAGLNEFLLNDEAFQTEQANWSDVKLSEPLFARIDTRLLKSFSGMPEIRFADYCLNREPERVFELRIYESHTADHAQRKVQMFNDGEIQLMNDVGLGPVFFAETVAGPDMPCLVYMLSAASLNEHKAHWQAFLNDPRWPEMRDKPEYKDTVSKIQNWTLQPADFSGM